MFQIPCIFVSSEALTVLSVKRTSTCSDGTIMCHSTIWQTRTRQRYLAHGALRLSSPVMNCVPALGTHKLPSPRFFSISCATVTFFPCCCIMNVGLNISNRRYVVSSILQISREGCLRSRRQALTPCSVFDPKPSEMYFPLQDVQPLSYRFANLPPWPSSHFEIHPLLWLIAGSLNLTTADNTS